MAGIIFFILGFFSLVQANVKTPPPHVICSAKEIKLRDCSLALKPYEIVVSRVKITWSDGTWKSIADTPMSDEKFVWEKVTVEKFANRFIMQFWIWDDGPKADLPKSAVASPPAAPSQQPKVQSLHWVVGEFRDQRYIQQSDQVVRKREVRSTTPVTYNYDKWIKHQLKVSKPDIEWTVGRFSGKF
jgi:hypothetical protein